MDTNDIVEELNELAQLDHDASRTYEEALSHVEEEAAVAVIRTDLESFRLDHLRHIAELRRAVESLGGASIEPSRDLKGVLLEGMTKLRSVTGTAGALKAMRMNEKLTNRSYERASELDLPPVARDVVLAGLADERRHLAAIEAHLERLGAEEEVEDEREAGDEGAPRVVPPPEDLHPGVRM
jgi:rubrerythrin